MILILAEKPSVGQAIAKVLGATQRGAGYVHGNCYIVSWCFGHLVELAQPKDYDPALEHGISVPFPLSRKSSRLLSKPAQKNSSKLFKA